MKNAAAAGSVVLALSAMALCTVPAQEPVLTNLVRHPGGLELSWSSAVHRAVVLQAPAAQGPYLFSSSVLTQSTTFVSNDNGAAFFRVRRVTVVNPPDTNIANALRAALVVKAEPTNEMYDFELAQVTNLIVVNKGVTNLSGLEYTSLTSLNVSLNEGITDLSPLAGLTNLARLEISDNAVSNLSPLAGLRQLTSLEMYRNTVSDLSVVSNLTALTRLWLFGNQISDLSPLAGLTNLTQLLARDNLITNLAPLAGLTRLSDLRVENNAIADVDALAALTNLQTLSLTSNSIVDIGALASNALAGGLGTGDIVRLQGNPLSDFAKTNDIPILTNRGANVLFDP